MNSVASYKVRASALFYSLVFIAVFLFPPLSAAATTYDVTVGNNFFSPNDLTIEVGDTVRWTNNSGGTHDVTADDASFASQTSSNFVFSRTFNSIEEVLYYCSVHSSPGQNRDTRQNGRINVVAATAVTDVSVDSVDAVGGSHETGENLIVKAVLNNTGAADSGMFNIDFYLSTDETITNADTLIGTESITNIASGAVSNIEATVALPANLDIGDYYIGAIIDLDDTDLTNNTNVTDTPIFAFDQFTMNPGLNDAWFNPETSGQGFFITIFPALNFVSLAWFTYDTELPPPDATANLGDPGHRWITGAGVIIDNQAVIDVVLTSGGIFDTPGEVERTTPPGSDGTITLTFKNCNSGTAEYDLIAINAQGTVPLIRVANDNIALCDAMLRESQIGE
jgi:plastocyanin